MFEICCPVLLARLGCPTYFMPVLLAPIFWTAQRIFALIYERAYSLSCLSWRTTSSIRTSTNNTSK